MSWFKNALLLLLLGLLTFGAFQKRYGIVRSKPLHGYFSSTPKPAFSCSTWFTGAYQNQYRISLEDSVGFKSDFVRLYNQIDFSLFSIAHANKLVVGKEGYLFAKETYIDGYTGIDFAGKSVIDHKIVSLKFLQDYLWKEKGILVLVVFAPGKGFYYPEFIPDRYLKRRNDLTNYGYSLQRCKEEGINHIDFNQWLISMKDTSRHVLYPKTGIHWSNYGAWLCADSLHNYIETRLNRKIPRMVPDSLEIVKEARGEDNDMERTMNLIWPIDQPAFTYPAFHFRYDSVQPKPSGLVVGDSFYWYWYYSGIIENTFSNKEFWYYNNEIYPEQFTTPKNVGQIDYVEAILRQNVIILLQTNGGYGALGYGWIDLAYDHLYPGMTRTKEIEQQMKSNPEWMKSLAAKAKERNITTDHMMRLDAIYMMNQEIKKKITISK
jgi:hypothetical protein